MAKSSGAARLARAKAGRSRGGGSGGRVSHFIEEQHPRAQGGKFTDKGFSEAQEKQSAGTKKRAGSPKPKFQGAKARLKAAKGRMAKRAAAGGKTKPTKKAKAPPKPAKTKAVTPKDRNASQFASKAEHDAARKIAKAKTAAAPVPPREKVEAYRAKLKEYNRVAAEARRKGEKVPQQREYLDARGNSASRKARAQKLFKEFGGEERGYIVCHDRGIKMHWTDDPKLNPHGYPRFEQGKIFTAAQGGGYQMPNLLPESFAANRSRNDRAVRPENLD